MSVDTLPTVHPATLDLIRAKRLKETLANRAIADRHGVSVGFIHKDYNRLLDGLRAQGMTDDQIEAIFERLLNEGGPATCNRNEASNTTPGEQDARVSAVHVTRTETGNPEAAESAAQQA